MAKKRTPKELEFETGRVLVGSCLDRLKDLEDGSVDSIVTDPPYELGFMGKAWDASGIAYNVELWRECLRVLKPGGHLLAFGGTRTYHRMAVAIEDAGFEIRDSIHWVYGSGFPKSHNVSIGIDKQAGVMEHRGKAHYAYAHGTDFQGRDMEAPKAMPPHEGITDAAKQWAGWGTALKPGHEPIVLARKPLDGTVAENVQEHGVGALNIDGCRIGEEPVTINTFDNGAKPWGDAVGEPYTSRTSTGRWPANIIFDEAAGAELDAQSELEVSRFFYCPKPGKKERNAGLEKLKVRGNKFGNQKNGDDIGNGSVNDKFTTTPSQNFHPTVKPIELMRYLCRLITPPGGTVLDPFLGSGTTAVAAVLEGFQWVGCEMTADYLPIIKGRVQWAEKQPQKLL